MSDVIFFILGDPGETSSISSSFATKSRPWRVQKGVNMLKRYKYMMNKLYVFASWGIVRNCTDEVYVAESVML